MNASFSPAEELSTGNPVKSIIKALTALDILALQDVRRSGIGLFDLSRQLGIRPNTLHNILKTMVLCGYVSQNEDGKYIAGPKCDQISAIGRLISDNTLNGVIRPVLLSLSKKLGENVVFTVLSNGRRYQLVDIEGKGPVRVSMQYTGNSIYSLVTGRLLVAYADSAALQLIVENYGFPGKLWDNIEDMPALEKACYQLRQEKYMHMHNTQGELDTFGISILLGEEHLVACIGVFLPSYRCSDERSREILSSLEQARTEILNRLS